METQYYKETIDGITYDVSSLKNNYKTYYLNNKLHNASGPAYIRYYENGNICFEQYYIKGIIHNESGPATIKYNSDNNILLNINADEELKQYLKFKNF